ncbi:MAG: VWA domain-containing protein [Planctomycetota bacterium]
MQGNDQQNELQRRWRLILGRDAVQSDGKPLGGEPSEEDADIDQALEFLFDREYGEETETYRPRAGGGERSRLTVPSWLSKVRKLFPKSTSEQMTRLALDRYGLTEVLADEKVLETMEPNMDLLRAILATQNVLPERLLGAARRIVRQVVRQLMERLRVTIRKPFSGAIDTTRPTSIALARNFDAKRTIRHNLKNYQPAEQRLLIERAYFHSRVHRQYPWDIILLVDQSGSMLSSVIHSAIVAGIFHSLPHLRTHLVAFDTSIVDLTDQIDDPVEVLFRVQLGGGTDITQAMRYAETLVRNPRRTILVLVTDFYENSPIGELLAITAKLAEDGVTLLGLAALDDSAEPAYHKDLARRLCKLGMHVAAMTPDKLAEWVAKRVRA